jgi:uncharacterized protein with HEPN domain
VKEVIPYLHHILDAIEAIEAYTLEGKQAFLDDRKTQDAVIRNLEIIGEATRNIPERLRNDHPSIPWRQAAALRNVLIHQYFGVDLHMVWGVVETELPPIKANLRQLLSDLSDG